MRYAVKKAGKRLFILVAVVLALIPAVHADQRRVFDQAGLFSQKQISELENGIAELSGRISMDIAVVTTDDAQGKTAMAFADDFYDANNIGTGEDYSGALFLIDTDNREIDISTSGRMIDVLTDERIGRILDDAHVAVSEEDFHAAATAFLAGVDRYVEEGIRPGHYRYDTDTGRIVKERALTIEEILISAVIAAAAGGAVCIAVAAKYKMRSGTYRYPFSEKGRLSLTRREDVFINRTLTSHLIQTTQSGGSTSGRSSVHRSSSGRTHGGGGRKF